MRALLLTLLLPSLASAGMPAAHRANNWSRATLHIPATVAGTTLKTTTGTTVTFARGSAATYRPTASTVAKVLTDVARVESAGFVSEVARTNCMHNSEALDSWNARNSAVVVADATAAPDGTMTADQLTVNGAFDDVYQGAGGGDCFPCTKTVNTSFWIKRISTTGVVKLTNPSSGPSDGDWRVDLDAIGAGWVRIVKGGTGVTEVAPFQCIGAAGLSIYAASGGPLDFYIWGVQQEGSNDSSPGETSYIPTTGSDTVRSTDFYSIDSHLRPGDKDWCIAMKMTPVATTQTWSADSYPRWWDLGGNGIADSCRFYGFNNNTDQLLQCYGADAAAGNTETPDPSVGVATTMHICNKNGVTTIYKDGVADTQTRAGTGTNILAFTDATMQKLEIGNTAGGVGSKIAYQNVRVCRTSDPKRCK